MMHGTVFFIWKLLNVSRIKLTGQCHMQSNAGIQLFLKKVCLTPSLALYLSCEEDETIILKQNVEWFSLPQFCERNKNMSKFANSLVRFHGDDAGNEAVTTVAILAVGATVLIGLLGIWGTVKEETTSLVSDVLAGGSGAAGGN
jgi:hypothetical protein